MPVRRARILLIDDNEADFVITRKLLAQLDANMYELDWADTYEEGLRQLTRARHDVCLLDYRLGDRDGLSLLSAAAERGVGIPTILLTSYGDDEVDQRALVLGASGFLDKGRLRARDLDRAVRYALSREGRVSELLDRNTQLKLLHELTSTLLDAGDDIDLAAVQTANSTGFPIVLIERLDAARGILRTLGCCGTDMRPGHEYPVEESPAKETVATGRPTLELHGGAATRLLGPNVRTCVCLPMQAGSELLGALTLAHSAPVSLDVTQLQNIQVVADHLGNLLSSARTGSEAAQRSSVSA